MGLKDTESNYRQNKVFMESLGEKKEAPTPHSSYKDLTKLLLYPGDDRLSQLPLDKQIIGRANALYLDQLSHREVVEKLTAEGYPRPQVVALIREYAARRNIQPNVTAPLIFFIVCVAAFIWSQWSTPYPIDGEIDYRVMQLRTLKMLISVVTMVAIPALGLVVLYQHYEHIPGLNSVLEPIFHKRRTQQADVVAIDAQFTQGGLNEFDYEAALIAALGRQRGARHFRLMRNQKHFGLE
jgi:low affinity Fe/Cu permease